MASKITMGVADTIEIPITQVFNGGVAVHLSGTFSGVSLIPEGSIDGSTWFVVAMESYAAPGTYFPAISSANGYWTNCVGLQRFRIRCAALASGSPVVIINHLEG